MLRAPPPGWRDGIAAAEARAATRGRSRLQVAQATDVADWLPHDLLLKLDRCLMAHAVEGRTPFLDSGVADAAFRLPDALKVPAGGASGCCGDGWSGTCRQASPFAPKQGFTVPVGAWIAGQGARLGPLVAAQAGVAAIADPDRVVALFRNAAGRRERLRRLDAAVLRAVAPRPYRGTPGGRRRLARPGLTSAGVTPLARAGEPHDLPRTGGPAMNHHPGYISGFGNGFETEALPGALPVGRNSPQRCAYGLYAEQLSGSPFTAPRAANERSWLYRIRPTVSHWGASREADAGLWRTAPCAEAELPPAPHALGPAAAAAGQLSFVEGMRTITTAGDAGAQAGMAAHVYLATRSMQDEYFYNADGELLFVPQQGALRLCTEFGVIDVAPGEIAVIPRGVKLRVELPDGPARGYVCENYGGAFTLPERGPIGANCLANPRDFLTPVAAYEDRDAPSALTVKWGGALWQPRLEHSPLDVVAWHGNYAPYKYDLRRFSPVGPLLFDHADPSIFTVLTSPSRDAGHRQHRFRHLPGPLAGGRGHVPAALVPHERHERVHGPDLRRVRRQAGGASCPAASRCTTPCCRTARTPRRSKAPAPPRSPATSWPAPWPSCSRRGSRRA